MPYRPQCIASQQIDQSSLVYLLYNVLLGHLYILYYCYFNVSIKTSKKKKTYLNVKTLRSISPYTAFIILFDLFANRNNR